MTGRMKNDIVSGLLRTSTKRAAASGITAALQAAAVTVKGGSRVHSTTSPAAGVAPRAPGSAPSELRNVNRRTDSCDVPAAKYCCPVTSLDGVAQVFATVGPMIASTARQIAFDWPSSCEAPASAALST